AAGPARPRPAATRRRFMTRKAGARGAPRGAATPPRITTRKAGAPERYGKTDDNPLRAPAATCGCGRRAEDQSDVFGSHNDGGGGPAHRPQRAEPGFASPDRIASTAPGRLLPPGVPGLVKRCT